MDYIFYGAILFLSAADVLYLLKIRRSYKAVRACQRHVMIKLTRINEQLEKLQSYHNGRGQLVDATHYALYSAKGDSDGN